MRYKLLGQSGLRVSELFLGAMTFGDQRVGAPPQECRRILDLYADAGGNFVDTANFYGDGRSESILGELLEGRHDRFVGLRVPGARSEPPGHQVDPGERAVGGVAASLGGPVRLGLVGPHRFTSFPWLALFILVSKAPRAASGEGLTFV